MKEFFIGFVICLGFLALAFYAIGKASADETHYNTMHLDCGTLHGKGTVGIWFKDEYYLIPIACQ